MTMESIIEFFPFDQIWIMIFASSAIMCLASAKSRTRKVGAICGMLAEPAWVWAAWHDKNGGIILLSLVFMIGYIRAYRNNKW